MHKAGLKNTTAIVKAILEKDQRARNSDNFLYLRVIEHIAEREGFNLRYITVSVFLKYMGAYGFPPFETVRRARQKIQREFPELSASKEVTDQRAENEEVFREYAREGVSVNA